MPLQPFHPDRSCPHCQARGSLYLEEIWGEVDLVCIMCGYRRTAVMPRKRRPSPAAGRQEALPLAG